MFPLYLGGLVCILIWCECLIFEKVSLHFHRVSLSNTEPTLQGFRGLKQHGDFRSFVLQFQVVRSEGHFRKRKIDSNLFFHRFHFFLSRKSSFVWCDCPSRNLYSVGEDLVLCRRCFLCEHFHSIQHAGWCCAWVSWDYITKVFVQYLLWLLFEILCLQWLRTRYNRTGLRGEKSLFWRTDEVDAFDEEDHVAGMSSPNKKCCATGYFPRTSPANIWSNRSHSPFHPQRARLSSYLWVLVFELSVC